MQEVHDLLDSLNVPHYDGTWQTRIIKLAQQHHTLLEVCKTLTSSSQTRQMADELGFKPRYTARHTAREQEMAFLAQYAVTTAS